MKKESRWTNSRFAVLVAAYLACAPALADTLPPGVIIRPAPTRFSICQGGGCHTVDKIALSPSQWRRIAELFQPPSPTAALERLHIAQAVGALERIVGAKTGTALDLGGTFQGLGRPGQMDCIDESVNTTTYLQLLQGAGLLKWHTVEDRVTRGYFLFGWPHTTAVIRESATGWRYAVDSWFEDNGTPPYIIPLEPWRRGWRPLP